MKSELTAFQKELILCLKARIPLIYVVTSEEERVMKEIIEACNKTDKPCLSWDIADGFVPLTSVGNIPGISAKDPLSALDAVIKINSEEAVIVFKDFHSLWEKNPQVIRKAKNIAQALKQKKKNIIITAHAPKIPEEIRDQVYTMEYAPPGYDEIKEILDDFLKIPNIKVALTPLGKDRIIRSALGLSVNQAQRVFAKAIVRKGSLDEQDIDLITAEKKEIIRESGALEFYPVTETLDNLGGLDVLKSWLKERDKAFTIEAKNYGLRPPKGILLMGIPGTGKSLTSKVIAGIWHQPLLRLDMGAIFGSLVGQSEENIRKALRLAETVSPCILWIDEVEKGISTGAGDSGTSSRVFGTLLSWMEDKKNPVFVVATANDILRIPPEFSRAGRFDSVFFLDLPTLKERKEIFEVHLRRRRPVIDEFNIEETAKKSEGFVGAEIEQAIESAMVKAFNNGGREFTTKDILESLKEIIPLVQSQGENIKILRRWLEDGRARSASFPEKESALRQQVKVPDFGATPAIEVDS